MNDQPTDDSSVEIDGAAPEGAAPGVAPDDETAPEPEASEGSDEFSRITAERDEYLESLQRVAAEFDNYRKRTERERASAASQAGRSVLEQLLPVMDSLARAVEALADVDEARAGVAMVEQQLGGVLAAHGLNRLDPAENDPFDPQIHEAVQSLPSPGHEPGTLVAVIQTGYRFSDGSLLRPARVVVAAAETSTE